MFDVAPAFQTTRRKRMARSRQPTPIHFKSSLTCQMSLTSAFVHWRLLKKFVVFSFYFAWDDFGFQTRLTTLRRPSTEKQCIKLLSLFLFVFVGYTCEMLARFGDSLALHHSGDWRERARVQYPATHSRSLSTVSRSLCHFHSYFPSQTVDCPVVNVSVWFCRTAGGRRRMLTPRSTAAHRCPPLGQNRVLYL